MELLDQNNQGQKSRERKVIRVDDKDNDEKRDQHPRKKPNRKPTSNEEEGKK